MTFQNKLPIAASLTWHVISLSSLSKTYDLRQIRVGWLICQENKLMETILATKEKIMICSSVFDKEITYCYMLTRDQRLPLIL